MRRIMMAALGALAPIAAPAVADDDDVARPSGRASTGGVETFAPDYFALYNPVTAADMVARVPGFSVDNGDDDLRGFGAGAGNVLINGERPSSKSAVSDQLARIAAANVARIDLIRGGASDLDVRGQGQIVNVVLAAGAAGAPSTTYELQLRYNQAGRIPWFGQVSRSFSTGKADVTLTVELPSGDGRSTSTRRLFDASGALLETRDEFTQETYRDITFAGVAAWRPTERDVFNVNAKAYPWTWSQHESTIAEDADGDLAGAAFNRQQDNDGFYAEGGADWERRLTDAVSVKLIGLFTHQSWGYTERHADVAPGASGRTTLIDRATEDGERVARGVVTWRAGDAHTLETGLETAFNYRDTEFDLTKDDGSGPVAVDLPVSTTRVEELRGEAFVTDVWSVTPKLNLESGFTYEASRITQSGDAEQERELTYPKPHVLAAYTFDRGDQVRLSLRREVSQLDFGDFASSVSQTDDVTDFGNPDLEPERAWRARAEWQRALGARGGLTLAVFHDRVEGVSGMVRLHDPDPDDDIFPVGFGNLGDGTRTGAEVEATMGLDWLGVANATLQLDGMRQTSEVTDPITGVDRLFEDEAEWTWAVDFRQDLPGAQLAWGWDYSADGSRQYFRADQTRRESWAPGDLDVFIETTRFAGVTVRFGVDSIFDPEDRRRRVFYDGLRSDGVVTGVETRERTWGQFYKLTISGSF